MFDHNINLHLESGIRGGRPVAASPLMAIHKTARLLRKGATVYRDDDGKYRSLKQLNAFERAWRNAIILRGRTGMRDGCDAMHFTPELA